MNDAIRRLGARDTKDTEDTNDASDTGGATGAKICGLTNEADLDAAVAAGADAVGFVTSVPVDSSREIAPGRARELIDRTPRSVTSVAVTMPDSPVAAAALVERVDPDALQVHAIGPEDVAAIREAVAVPLIAAIDADGSETGIERVAESADALLIDSLDAAGAGGTGETGDWERAREVVASSSVPVILAGGLDPENVARAIAAVEPFAVDVASGVEASGGRKDHDALDRFLSHARRARVGAEV